MPLGVMKRPSSYSHCPLKKRPLKYDPLEDSNSDSDLSFKGPSPSLPMDLSEPENLSTKPEDLRVTNTQKTILTSSPPPPLSLIAGRGDSYPAAHQQQFRQSESVQFDPKMISPSHYQAHYQVKSSSSTTSGPLGPLNLNAPAAWSKINYVPTTMPLNYVPATKSVGIFSPSVPRSSTQQNIGQFLPPSHFTPSSGNNFREPGSPPHISPPLSHEPAYPVLRIEEHNNKSRYMDEIKAFPQNQHHQIKQESYYHQTSESPTPSYYNNYHHHHHHQLSPPSRSPISHPDSVLSTKESNNQEKMVNATTIVPVNVNGSVRYQCPDCNKSYSTHAGLHKHMQFHCASQNKKSFVCKFCEKVYVSLGALKMHERSHTKPNCCGLCNKRFSRPWLLQGHIRTHTGEKPFICHHCNRAFADRSNLRAHLQTHSDVKKYSCKSCSKTFSRMSLLTKHEEGGCSNCILSNSD